MGSVKAGRCTGRERTHGRGACIDRFAACLPCEVNDSTEHRAVLDRLGYACADGAGGLEPAFDDRLDSLQDPKHHLPPSCCFDTALRSYAQGVYGCNRDEIRRGHKAPVVTGSQRRRAPRLLPARCLAVQSRRQAFRTVGLCVGTTHIWRANARSSARVSPVPLLRAWAHPRSSSLPRARTVRRS